MFNVVKLVLIMVDTFGTEIYPQEDMANSLEIIKHLEL